MAVYTETIELKDQMSDPAKKAEAQIKTLQSAIVSTENALTKAQATGNIKKYQALSKDLSAYKSALEVIPPVENELATATDGVSASSMGFQAELAAMTGGLSIAIEVILAAVAAFGLLVFAGAKFAIEASAAKDASISLFNALGQGKITGEEVDGMLDDLRASTGLTKDSLSGMTSEFLKMGITGKDALAGLTIAAASAEALAKGGAKAFTSLWQQASAAAASGSKLTIPYKELQNQLVAMGLNVDDLAKQMGMSSDELTKNLQAGTVDAKKFGDALENAVTKKGAGPLATLANSAENLGGILKEYIGDLFEDFGEDIKPFLAEVKSMFDILGQAQPSGQALKSGIGAFFKEVFAIATKVVPMVKHFLLDLVILGLKAYIAIKPIVAELKRIWIENDGMGKMIALWEMLKPALIFVGITVAAVAAAFVTLMVAGSLVGAAIWGVAAAISSFIAGAAADLISWALEAGTIAYNFVSGLVTGITNGQSLLIDAVKKLAGSAVDSFKSALGIASDSKVMMKMGGYAASGAATGIENSESKVEAATTSLAGSAVSGFAGGAAPGNSTSSQSGTQVTVEAGAIVIQGGSSESIIELTETAVALIFERIAFTQGG